MKWLVAIVAAGLFGLAGTANAQCYGGHQVTASGGASTPIETVQKPAPQPGTGG